MFFYLSKIIWALLAPANMAFVLIALGLLLGLKWEETSRFFVVAGFAVLFILGFLPTGQNLLYHLEKQGSRPSPMPAHIDGILVLGGAIETRESEISGQPQFNDGAERVLSAMELARRYPDAKIVFSGGSGLCNS